MRLPPLAPNTMAPETRSFHDRLVRDEEESFQGFDWRRDDGALIGPFPPMLHFPQFGKPAWAYIKALIDHSKLPKAAHEVAILVVGAHFGARYEIYAHEHVAGQAGLAEAKIATICCGQRPHDLTEEEAIAYDVAAVLSQGRQLPESMYRRTLNILGKEQAAELNYLIGGYCMLSVLLNAYDVPVPGSEEGLSEN